MSGKPSPGGVALVISILAELEATENNLEQLVPERDRLVKTCQEEAEKRAALQRKLKDHLSQMDVDAPGNYGWESRFGWLLAEFRRQLLAEQRDRAQANEP